MGKIQTIDQYRVTVRMHKQETQYWHCVSESFLHFNWKTNTMMEFTNTIMEFANTKKTTIYKLIGRKKEFELAQAKI